jgi:hypothetical protein
MKHGSSRKLIAGLAGPVMLVSSLLLVSCTTSPSTSTSTPSPVGSVGPAQSDSPQTSPLPTNTSTITSVPGNEADAPEAAIRAYFAYLDDGNCKQAYQLLASARANAQDLTTYVKGCQDAWAGARVVSIRSMGEWLAERGVTPSPDQVGSLDQPRYAVEVDMQWKEGWVPVVPAGVNLQFITLVQEDGEWKLLEIGTGP